jgi:glycosyltransferase involved in cell wall biosynthesis
VSTTPLISVVVPAYNVERFLADAVGSVLGQTWKRLELVIVDDGSADGTPELARRFAAEDSRVRVISRANGGPSAARNTGIAEASGELICFLDADDALLPDKLERQVGFLEFFRSCDLVYSDHYIGDDRLNPLRLECRSPPPLPLPKLLAFCNWFAPMSPLMRTHLVRQVGGFDEDLRGAEDWDFWLRASHHGVLAYLPGPVGVYRTHPGQAHHNLERMLENREKVIRKHFQPGSEEWRLAHAARAWSDAKRSRASRNYTRMAFKLLGCAWHARTRRDLRNILDFAY